MCNLRCYWNHVISKDSFILGIYKSLFICKNIDFSLYFKLIFFIEENIPVVIKKLAKCIPLLKLWTKCCSCQKNLYKKDQCFKPCRNLIFGSICFNHAFSLTFMPIESKLFAALILILSFPIADCKLCQVENVILMLLIMTYLNVMSVWCLSWLYIIYTGVYI